MNGGLFSLEVYNSELYAGGGFSLAGSTPVNNIARWNGTSWSAVGIGVDNIPKALKVYNNELYAVGSFTQAGSVTANHIAKWDGTNWSVVGTGLDNDAYCLSVYNSELYVGGAFTLAGGNTCNEIAKWNNPLGINELTSSFNVSVYPSPTRNTLHIGTKNAELEKSEIEITNIIGQSVLQTQFSDKIDVSKLPAGVYTLKITTEKNQSFHSRFVKE